MRIGNLVFSVERKMKILNKDKQVDEITIKSINRKNKRIKVESLKLYPGKTFWFGFVERATHVGWRMLFEDPRAGGLCYSERAPIYHFELIA